MSLKGEPTRGRFPRDLITVIIKGKGQIKELATEDPDDTSGPATGTVAYSGRYAVSDDTRRELIVEGSGTAGILRVRRVVKLPVLVKRSSDPVCRQGEKGFLRLTDGNSDFGVDRADLKLCGRSWGWTDRDVNVDLNVAIEPIGLE